MRQWLAAGLLAALVALALPVSAQESAPGLVPEEGEILGPTSEQTFAVGVGVIAGAIVLHAFLPADITYFAGGLLGGLLASWWYDSGGVDRLSAAIDGSAAAAETPSPGHVLQIRERR
jgi:hypothetical protein